MYCFIERFKALTASDCAAWVQAISSVLAILVTTGISIFQSRRQHREAMRIFAEQRNLDRLESSKNFYVISRNCLQIAEKSALELDSREKIHDIAEGRVWFDHEALKAIESAANAIPLHELEDCLVTPAMRLSGAVRQLRMNVEVVLENHRFVDAEKFEEFSNALRELCGVIAFVNKEVQNSA